jgi:hypothetical protein
MKDVGGGKDKKGKEKDTGNRKKTERWSKREKEEI